MSLSDGLIDAELAAAFVDTGPEMVRGWKRRRPVQFQHHRGLPRLPPGAAGGEAARRTVDGVLRSSRSPSSATGRTRVTVGPQMSGNILHQRDRARPRRPGWRAREPSCERRTIPTSGAPDRASSVRCCGPASTAGSSRRPGRGRSSWSPTSGRVVGCRLRDRRRDRERCTRGGGRAGHRRVRVGPRARAQPSCAARWCARRPCRPTPATACGWRCGSAPRWATCARRGGCRSSTSRWADGGTAAWQVNGERTRPHCIMVNGRGRRFTNEAANYNALGAAFHVIDVTDVRLRQPSGLDDLRRALPHPLRAGQAHGRPSGPCRTGS